MRQDAYFSKQDKPTWGFSKEKCLHNTRELYALLVVTTTHHCCLLISKNYNCPLDCRGWFLGENGCFEEWALRHYIVHKSIISTIPILPRRGNFTTARSKAAHYETVRSCLQKGNSYLPGNTTWGKKVPSLSKKTKTKIPLWQRSHKMQRPNLRDRSNANHPPFPRDAAFPLKSYFPTDCAWLQKTSPERIHCSELMVVAAAAAPEPSGMSASVGWVKDMQ